MNKIKCVECGEELVSKHRHDFVSCSCINKAFTDGGDAYQRVGAKDLTKILLWNEEKEEFESPIL